MASDETLDRRIKDVLTDKINTLERAIDNDDWKEAVLRSTNLKYYLETIELMHTIEDKLPA